jgi:hypothetical protein
MRLILPILAAAAAGGCASVMRGPDTCAEIHFDATYVLARWAGWPAAESRAIAAANFWTDKHAETNSVATEWRVLGGIANPATVPLVLCLGLGDLVIDGESPRRAFGRRVAESTAWAVPSLGHSLHFPAIGLRSTVLPAFYLNPVSGEIEYGNAEARRVLERAFFDFLSHDEDAEANLALLGIGLHTLQDSFKHSGYTAAQGHIGAHPDPDRACCNLDATMLSAEVTLNSLRYARRLVAGASCAPPPGWKQALRLVFARPAAPDGEPDRRWGKFVRSQFNEEYASRDALVERWQADKGQEAFDRALDRVREAME